MNATTRVRRWLLRGNWVGFFGIIVIASAALARPGIVHTKDGRTVEGEITEKDQSVSVTVRGIEMSIERANITSIEYAKSFQEQYAERLKKLDAKDVQGRLALARWASENKQYALARSTLDDVLAIDPNNKEATDFHHQIRAQMQLESGQKRNGSGASAAGGTGAAPPPARGGGPGGAAPAGSTNLSADDRRFLSAEDVNNIRLSEMKETDRVRIRFENNAVKRYASAKAEPFKQVSDEAQSNPARLARKMIDEDQKYAEDIKILNDPTSMLEYRQKVQPMVMSGCASSGCHGGTAGGKLVLFSGGAEAQEAVAYTNFFILQNYSKDNGGGGAANKGGVFAQGQGRQMLIDRTAPSESLLAEYILPAELSQTHHPEVAGFRPIVRNKEDARYRALIGWMKDSLVLISKPYDVKYEPPTGSAAAAGDVSSASATAEPASAPATKPAAQPSPKKTPAPAPTPPAAPKTLPPPPPLTPRR